MPAAPKLLPEQVRVLDDPVVHDGDLAGRVDVRVRVRLGGRTVSRPAGVRYAGRTGHGPLQDGPIESLDPPGHAPDLESVSILDRQSGGVVAPIFESFQSLEEYRSCFAGSDVRDDSTHDSNDPRDIRSGDSSCR